MGYRIPAVLAAVSTRFIPSTAAPILDAGCGGGIQAEALIMLGLGPITGIDLSEGMLEVARAKGTYSDLRQMTLGEKLDFADDAFDAIISSGTITPRHAPPSSFDGLIRVAKPGAPIVFSLRDDPAQEPEYPEAVKRLTDAGYGGKYSAPRAFRACHTGNPRSLTGFMFTKSVNGRSASSAKHAVPTANLQPKWAGGTDASRTLFPVPRQPGESNDLCRCALRAARHMDAPRP